MLFLLVPVNALGTIQNTIFMRQFRFALLSKITFVASLASGVLAVTMALAGCGVWSLVGAAPLVDRGAGGAAVVFQRLAAAPHAAGFDAPAA